MHTYNVEVRLLTSCVVIFLHLLNTGYWQL